MSYQPPAPSPPRVLLIAESANPEWVSGPLVAWSHYEALARLVDVHLVTRLRNSDAIRRAGVPDNRVTAIDSQKIAAPLWQLASFLRGDQRKGWTTTKAIGVFAYYYFERLVWRRFAAEITSGKFDVVHRLSPISPTWPSIIARRCARACIPFVIGPLNGGLARPKYFQNERRRELEWLSYVRFLCKLLPAHRATRTHASAILLASRATWHDTSSSWHHKCIYLPENAIDRQRFPPCVDRSVAEPLRLAFVGRLVPLKGVDMLLEAARPFIEEGRMTLDIIGDGPEMEKLRAFVTARKLQRGVRLDGWLEHEHLAERLIQSGVLSCHDACAAESAEPPASPPLTDLDVASIVFTSGSTETPLGATLSHLNIVSNTRSIVEYLHLTRAERMLAILPFHYVYGKSLLNTHAAAGATVVIENRFLYPNTALDTLENEECTGLAGVPSTFAILLNRSNLAERELPQLRYVTQAGGPMSPDLTRRLMEALPGRSVVIMYGATEASARLSYLDPEELPRKIGSIGKAIPNVELRVLREDGAEAEVGEVGEIVARGSNMMSGYWGNPEATAEVFDEHGYHTGDLARRDEEGFLYVVGRKRDFIKSGAHRISSLEIEHAILELPQIHEVAVIGVPDEILGEKIKGFVVFREGFEADPLALEKTLKKKLAHKAPSEIEVRDDLPKSPAGKIMKQALR